jgi:hypothetical protein
MNTLERNYQTDNYSHKFLESYQHRLWITKPSWKGQKLAVERFEEELRAARGERAQWEAWDNNEKA